MVIMHGDLEMPFEYFVYGDKPKDGRSLFISMHGGGNTPKRVNDSQWENQKRLHSSVTNDEIECLFEIALANGAIGGKACGAGGGGCLLFYCPPDKEHQVRRSLSAAGATILDFTFDFSGLQTWVSDY